MSKARPNPFRQSIRQLYRGAAGLPLLWPALALADPSGGSVVAGAAAISTPVDGTTQIDQSSASAIINWQEFSVGADEFVIFNQPSSSALVLNRVIGGMGSEILGQLDANGRVFIVNPMGVVFGEGSRVDVGGLMATTMDINDADFMNGKLVFSGDATAPVENRGLITADNGFVVLSAAQVLQAGTIQAGSGYVVLSAASGLTLDLDDSGLVSYRIDAATLAEQAGIANLGQILADGGTVVMHAATAQSLAGAAVNNQGLVRAAGIQDGPGGTVLLTADGGDIRQTGSIDVSGASGGTARLIASGHLEVTDEASIDASAERIGEAGFVELSGHDSLHIRGVLNIGAGGRLLIDPTDVAIGNGTECGASFCENQVEQQLRSGTQVDIIASNSITVEDLADDALDGRNAGAGGNLFLGIGTVDSYGGFVPGTSGSITANDLNDQILIDGNADFVAGSDSLSNISLGDVSAANIGAEAGGNINLRDLTVANSQIALTAGNDIVVRDISATHVGPGSAEVRLHAGNGISFGTIDVALDSGSSFSKTRTELHAGNGGISGTSVTQRTDAAFGNAVTEQDINAAGGSISIGSVTASATATGATASVDVDVNNSSGAIVIGGLDLQADAAGSFSRALTDADFNTGGSGSIDVASVALRSTNTGSHSFNEARAAFDTNTLDGAADYDLITVDANTEAGRAEARFDGNTLNGVLNVDDITITSRNGFGTEADADLFSNALDGSQNFGSVTVRATLEDGGVQASSGSAKTLIGPAFTEASARIDINSRNGVISMQSADVDAVATNANRSAADIFLNTADGSITVTAADVDALHTAGSHDNGSADAAFLAFGSYGGLALGDVSVDAAMIGIEAGTANAGVTADTFAGDVSFDSLSVRADGQNAEANATAAIGTFSGVLTLTQIDLDAIASGTGNSAFINADLFNTAGATTIGSASLDASATDSADAFSRLTLTGSSNSTGFGSLLNTATNTGTGDAIAQTNLITGDGNLTGTTAGVTANDSGGGNADAVLTASANAGDIDIGAASASANGGGAPAARAFATLDVFSTGGSILLGSADADATTLGGDDALAQIDLFVQQVGRIEADSLRAAATVTDPTAGDTGILAQGSIDAVSNASTGAGALPAISIGSTTVTASNNGAGGANADAFVFGNGNTDAGTVDISAIGGANANAAADLQSNELFTAGTIDINATAGEQGFAESDLFAFGDDIVVGDIGIGASGGSVLFATNAFAQLTSSTGDIDTGGIVVDSTSGPSTLFASADGALTINGDLTVTGGGGESDNSQPRDKEIVTGPIRIGQGGFEVVTVDLYANSAVNLTGDLTLTAAPSVSRSSFSGDAFEQTSGQVRASVWGDSVRIDGAVSADAIGRADISIYGTESVTIVGDTRVDVIAEQLLDSFGGSSLVQNDGIADVHIGSYTGFGNPLETRLDLGGLDISGPNAVLNLQADHIDTGAISVTALPGGPDSDGVFHQQIEDGVEVASTDIGVALLELRSDAEAGGGGILVDGPVSVSGASAGARLLALGDITIQGAVAISGSGFTLAGDFGGSSDGYGGDFPGYGGPLAVSLLGGSGNGLLPPPLDSGTLFWGAATLQVGSPDNGCVKCLKSHDAFLGPANSFTVNGALSVVGIGVAGAAINAGNVSLQGVTIDAASRGYGSVQGSYTEFSTFIESAGGSGFYDVTHTIGDGSGGAATVGDAALRLDLGSGGSATLGAVTVQGGSAQFGVDGDGGSLTTAAVTLTGSADNGAPAIYVDQSSYQGSTSAPALSPTTNAVLGGFNLFSVGFDDYGGLASIDTGDVTVSGHGLAAIAMDAQSISAGTLTANAADGAFQLEDPRNAVPGAGSLGHAAVLLNARGEAPAAIAGIGMTASQAAVLNARAAASGDVSVTAPVLIDAVPAEMQNFQHPSDALRNGYRPADGSLPVLAGNTLSAGGDLNLALDSMNISSGQFSAGQSLVITADSLLIDPSLVLEGTRIALTADTGDLVLSGAAMAGVLELSAASGDIRIVGGEFNDAAASAPGGSFTANAQRIEIGGDALVAGASIDLDASDEILVQQSLLHGTATTLSAGGDISFDEAFIAGATHSFTAGGDLLLSRTELGRGELVEADQFSADAGRIVIDRSNLLAAQQTLDADSIELNSGSLVASVDVDLNGGSVLAENANISAASTSITGSNELRLLGGSIGANNALLDGGTISLDGIEVIASEALNVSGANVSAGTANLQGQHLDLTSGNALLLSNTTMFAGRFTSVAGGSLQFIDTGLIADSAELTGSGIEIVDGSSIGASTGIDLTSTGGNLLVASSSLFGTGNATAAIDLQSTAAVLLENAILRGGLITIDAPATVTTTGPRALSAAQRNAEPGAVIADDNTTIDALALGVTAGRLIDFSAATLAVGTGSAPFGSDTSLLNLLALDNAELLPGSSAPNAAFSAPSVAIGQLGMAGDYLFIGADQLGLAGNISSETPLFVNLRPHTVGGDISVESLTGSSATLNLGAGDHLLALGNGGTIAIGGSGFGGSVTIGEGGAINLGRANPNLVFLSSGNVTGDDTIQTGGVVVVLGRVDAIEEPEPQTEQFRPSEETELSDKSGGGDEESDDEETGETGSSGTGSTSGERRYVSEETNAEAVLECS